MPDRIVEIGLSYTEPEPALVIAQPIFDINEDHYEVPLGIEFEGVSLIVNPIKFPLGNRLTFPLAEVLEDGRIKNLVSFLLGEQIVNNIVEGERPYVAGLSYAQVDAWALLGDIAAGYQKIIDGAK